MLLSWELGTFNPKWHSRPFSLFVLFNPGLGSKILRHSWDGWEKQWCILKLTVVLSSSIWLKYFYRVLDAILSNNSAVVLLTAYRFVQNNVLSQFSTLFAALLSISVRLWSSNSTILDDVHVAKRTWKGILTWSVPSELHQRLNICWTLSPTHFTQRNLQ